MLTLHFCFKRVATVGMRVPLGFTAEVLDGQRKENLKKKPREWSEGMSETSEKCNLLKINCSHILI